MIWDTYKKAFYAWEKTTANYMEEVLKSPAVLGPSGNLLTAVMKAKAATNDALSSWWGRVGLSTKRDQERALHQLNQLQSRLLDLEERLQDIQQQS